MRRKEDEFPQKIKNILAGRVGWRCSNPLCRKLTCGPSSKEEKVINVGEAAHICAASEGGPRYRGSMSSEERSSYDNGIWLCRTCAKLIDSDEKGYSEDKLREWKMIAEEYAEAEIRIVSPVESTENDRKIMKFIKICFDRPAFMDDIYMEGSMEDLDQAFEDTIIALNTGILRDRNGKVLKQSEGKSGISNLKWQETLETISVLLEAMRRRLKLGKLQRMYYSNNGLVLFYDRELADWINTTRSDILEQLSLICREAGVGSIRFRKRRYEEYL